MYIYYPRIYSSIWSSQSHISYIISDFADELSLFFFSHVIIASRGGWTPIIKHYFFAIGSKWLDHVTYDDLTKQYGNHLDH